MKTLQLKSSEADMLRKILVRFTLDADRRARGATIGAASVLHGVARDRAAAILASLEASRAA